MNKFIKWIKENPKRTTEYQDLLLEIEDLEGDIAESKRELQSLLQPTEEKIITMGEYQESPLF